MIEDKSMMYTGVGVFLFVGVVILLLAFFETKKIIHFLQNNTLVVDGKVTNLKQRSYIYRQRNENHSTTTVDMGVVFEYEGQQYEITESSYLLKYMYQIGDIVPVRVDQLKPAESLLDIFLSLWAAVIGIWILGGGFCLGAFGIYKMMS